MRKNLKYIAGLTLIEIMIGIIITSIMMAAMYTSYSVVNQSYTRVSEKAKISKSSRDLVAMLMRDIRMAGFRYYAGTQEISKFAIDTSSCNGGTGVILPKLTHIYFDSGFSDTTKDLSDPTYKSHNPIVVKKGIDEPDSIQIVYDDFNQNNIDLGEQPHLRYRITYFPIQNTSGSFGIYKRIQSFEKPRKSCSFFYCPEDVEPEDCPGLAENQGQWDNKCPQCTPNEGVLVRDNVDDIEFIPFDENGRVIIAGDKYPAPENTGIRDRLEDIRGVDVRITFRSKEEFFKNEAAADKPRIIQGLSGREISSTDKYLRDSVVVSVATRNIGGESFQ